MLLALPGAVRLRMATSMFDTCRAIMRSQLAHLSETERRVEMFRRTYRDDFDDASMRRIEAWIRAAAPASPPGAQGT